MNVFPFVRWYIYFHSVKDESSIQLGFALLTHCLRRCVARETPSVKTLLLISLPSGTLSVT